jgi:hypothetical protein
MSEVEITRRAAFGALGAVAIAPGVVVRDAWARRRAIAGGIRVDVAPLRGNAGNPTAAWVALTLPAALARAFAEVGRPAASVDVQIDYVILGPAAAGGFGAQGPTPDQMVGEVTVDGMPHPLRAETSYYPNAVDQPEFEQSNFDRIAQLSQAFAYWAARGYWGA